MKIKVVSIIVAVLLATAASAVSISTMDPNLKMAQAAAACNDQRSSSVHTIFNEDLSCLVIRNDQTRVERVEYAQ